MRMRSWAPSSLLDYQAPASPTPRYCAVLAFLLLAGWLNSATVLGQSSFPPRLTPVHLSPHPLRPTSLSSSPTLTPAQTDVLAAQVVLARQGISPGSIDAVAGSKTSAAIRAFQRKYGLHPSGILDEETKLRLRSGFPLLKQKVINEADIARLHPLDNTWLGKSEQPRLDYETILELVAEQHQSSPTLIRRLNPDVDWTHLAAGASLTVPNIDPIETKEKAAFVVICLAHRTLQAFDGHTNLLAHFPCSIGRDVIQRPLGRLEIQVLIPDPNYTFNPAVFPESEEGRRLARKLILPPGPNNPVGSVWIGLDRPGYGIHGTPSPERVGGAESHGCFRLSNWNARHLLQLTWLSLPVQILEACE